MPPTGQRPRQRDPIDFRAPRKLGHTTLSFGNIAKRFHEQSRIVHLLNGGVQVGGDIFRRLQEFAGPYEP